MSFPAFHGRPENVDLPPGPQAASTGNKPVSSRKIYYVFNHAIVDHSHTQAR